MGDAIVSAGVPPSRTLEDFLLEFQQLHVDETDTKSHDLLNNTHRFFLFNLKIKFTRNFRNFRLK